MNSERIEKIAHYLFSENQKRAKFKWLKGDLAPTSLEEAYAVQTRLHSIWESEGVGSIGGWKIAIIFVSGVNNLAADSAEFISTG